MSFACSICEEESTRICVQCTKDTCSNHLCDKCGCCSDCCDCDVPLDENAPAEPMHAQTIHPEPVYEEPAAAGIMNAEPPRPDPEPEPPHPPPDPDPFPDDGPEPEPAL